MNTRARRHRLRATVVTAGVYIVVGLTTAALSRSASSADLRTLWRLAAWGTSALVFGAHIGYERRLRTPSARVALHAAVAVALATLALAISAVIHQLMASPPRPSMLLAFAIWPILTGVPSFLVAFGVAAVLARKDQRGPPTAT